jgi:hypothetical protein
LRPPQSSSSRWMLNIGFDFFHGLRHECHEQDSGTLCASPTLPSPACGEGNGGGREICFSHSVQQSCHGVLALGCRAFCARLNTPTLPTAATRGEGRVGATQRMHHASAEKLHNRSLPTLIGHAGEGREGAASWMTGCRRKPGQRASSAQRRIPSFWIRAL